MAEKGWLTKKEMLQVFDCSPSVFEQTIRPHIDEKLIKKRGQANIYYCRGAIEAWSDARNSKPWRETGVPPGEQPPDAPATTPTDAYRIEKTRSARLERQIKEGQLLPVTAVTEMLSGFAVALRRAAERLQRRCGADAHRILDTAIEDYEREYTAAFARNGDAGVSDRTNGA